MSPPTSIALLIEHLNESPNPTDFSIAILDADLGAAYPERAYTKVDNHLGINAPDLPQLAREFREEYALLRRRYRRAGSAEIHELRLGIEMGILDITKCLLLVCPDHSTAWADRRRALLGDDVAVNCTTNPTEQKKCTMKKELDFCDLLFTQHSKA